MRTEVTDLMRMCERLFGMAMRTGELSEEECEVIAFYTKELHDKTASLCAVYNGKHASCPTDAGEPV